MAAHRFLVVVLLIVLQRSGIASESTGAITGTVRDETGMSLSGATVALAGDLIGALERVTGPNGEFRFEHLSPGTYRVECKMEGFSAYVNPSVPVRTSSETWLDMTMRLPTLECQMIISMPAGIEPRWHASISTAADASWLGEIPSVRDPWAVLQSVHGITLDRVNIGGSESGEQPELTALGDVGGRNTTWSVDGLTITDMYAHGASPLFFDFDSIKEITITIGGMDPSIGAAGAAINIVTKRGGDTPHGSARFGLTDDSLQSQYTKALASPSNPGGETTIDGYKWNPAFTRDTLETLREYGLEIGGPIWTDHAWFWGGGCVQEIRTRAADGTPGDTELQNIGFKITAQASDHASIEYQYMRASRTQRDLGAGPFRPTETTLDLYEPTDIHKAEVYHEIKPGFSVVAKIGFVEAGARQEPRGGPDKQVRRDINGVYHNSYSYYRSERPQLALAAESSHSSRMLGVRQELRFGFSYRRVDAESVTSWPGGGVVADSYYGIARIIRESHNLTRNGYLGFYASDSFCRDRLTIDVELRFDRQDGGTLATNAPANGMFPDILPAYNVPQKDAPFTWNNISPRIGATYDLSDCGKTLLRASFARYADQLDSRTISYLSPISSGITELDYYWNDLNADGHVQPGEIDLDYEPFSYGVTRTVLDPDLSAPRRTEMLVGVERHFDEDLVAGINVIWRRARNLTWRIGTDLDNPARPYTFDDYVLAGTVTGILPDGTPYSIPFYRLRDERRIEGAGEDYLLTNRHGYQETYAGVELATDKTFPGRGKLSGSFTWQRNRRNFDGLRGISDPTDLGDGDELAFRSAEALRSFYWVSTPRWKTTITGLCELPARVSLAGMLNAREGFPIVYHRDAFFVDPGVTIKQVPLEPIGSRDLPSVVTIDLAISRSVSLGDHGNLKLELDVFNLFNRNTPLGVYDRAYSQPDPRSFLTGQVRDLMYPRVVRLGARYSF